MTNEHQIIINETIKLLKGGGAHTTFEHAIDKLPAKLRGVKPYDLPYSIWQLVEHIRIAQWDMLQFCIDENHESPEWPDDYWPKEAEPPTDDAWDKAVKQIADELEEFINLVKNEDVYKTLPHGTGQNILREAIQVGDHTAYHTAEIIMIRRLLKDWK